jgi:hypothetical protein
MGGRVRGAFFELHILPRNYGQKKPAINSRGREVNFLIAIETKIEMETKPFEGGIKVSLCPTGLNAGAYYWINNKNMLIIYLQPFNK